jgi:hypothetical protein
VGEREASAKDPGNKYFVSLYESLAAIYLRIAQEKFPRPVSLGARAVGWVDSEVDAWITARIEASRKPSPEP